MKDRVLEILHLIRPDVDFEKEEGLLSNEILDSFDFIQIIAMLSEEFGIEIAPMDVCVDNFDNLNSILKMIQKNRE